MSTYVYLVTVNAPAGVTRDEIACHLADASRFTANTYHPSDPLSELPAIEVRDMAEMVA